MPNISLKFSQELRMLKKAAAAFLIGASLATWVGCTSNSNLYVYAAIPAANQIVVYREDPNAGVLTALAGSPLAAGPTVQSIVIHPSKKFLYAANAGESDVSLFTISSSGGLSEVTPRTNVGTAPTLLAMDPAGSYLYVGNSGSTNISVFSINASTGGLTAVGAPVPTGISPLNMKLSPAGNVLYVTGAGVPEGYIEVFSINAGVLTGIQVTQPGANPYGLAINPAGTYLYTANAGDNSISEFTINADGSLTPAAAAVGLAYSSPVALLVDNSGKYLYVADSTNLVGYSIGAGGGLSLLSASPFITGPQPDFIASDSTGNYLFVGNQSSPVIQSFSLDGSSGTLTSVGSYKVGGTATSIAALP
jgi:6-phosphogluconolactonase (cycloisomerase 2 family)